MRFGVRVPHHEARYRQDLPSGLAPPPPHGSNPGRSATISSAKQMDVSAERRLTQYPGKAVAAQSRRDRQSSTRCRDPLIASAQASTKLDSATEALPSGHPVLQSASV